MTLCISALKCLHLHLSTVRSYFSLEFYCIYWNSVLTLHKQWRIQDFSEVGAPTPPGEGRQHTILRNFPKNCTKLKEFGLPGGRPSLAPPLDPPLISHETCISTVIPGCTKLRILSLCAILLLAT